MCFLKQPSSPATGLEWPRGFQEVKVPRFHDSGTFKTTAAQKSRDHLISEALWQFPITHIIHIIS